MQISIKLYKAATVLLGITCISSVWQCHTLRQEVANLYSGRVMLHVVDADTGEVVPRVTLGFPTKLAGDLWPQSGGGFWPTQVLWTSPYPVDFTVSADGYQVQTLTFDRNSHPDQIVKLKRLAISTTTKQ